MVRGSGVGRGPRRRLEFLLLSSFLAEGREGGMVVDGWMGGCLLVVRGGLDWMGLV